MSRYPRARHLLPLGGLLVLAAALRLPGLAYGLPFPLLNPDERSIVPRAWELVHGGGLDPGWYDYPSLLLLVLAPMQLPFDEPSYGAARILIVAIGLGGVAAAWWLGRSAYGPSAGVLAGAACAVATVHVVYSHMAVTDVLLTTCVTVSLALLLTGRLEWAGVAAGLAASAKYPGILLAVPILLVGWREWRRLGLAAAGGVLAFFLTSPFVVIHAGAAWDDIARVQRLGRAGWLGFEDDPATPLAFLDRLWEALGPFLLIALAGLALALGALVLEQHKRLSRRGRTTVKEGPARSRANELVLEQHKLADLALASFALVWFVQLLPLSAHYDRYVLPLVPVLGALAGRLPRLAPVALALLVVPLAWSAGEVRELIRTDTRVVAHAWIQQNVPADALVAVEPSTPPVDPRRTLGLELPGPGRELDPNRDLARLRARGADYVLVTGAVADRVLEAADRYPRESAFYAELESATQRVLFVSPGGELGGPWVALYRL
ncbi:MAG TPA: glycosyltransferase 87 family protein [Gaiellaceae bacterium]|nr:glycosyltransferase 87 family protein [Gaiellaceae bacterium]